jgi:SM-20-related protein
VSEPTVTGAQVSRRIEVGTHRVVVVDGLFTDEAIAGVYRFLKTLPYSLRDYDSEDTADMRHWLSELPNGLAAGTPVLRECIKETEAQSAPSLLRPVRVHANLVTYGDTMFPHQDSDRGVTAIYYANPSWAEAWQGETVFYDGSEPVHTVAPRPGRLAIFDGAIFHRSGVPSRLCREPRITVAFKFDRD